MFYLVNSPWILKKMYPQCLWQVNTSDKKLYLTFDDGPHPEITPWVLDVLETYNAKGTFFCIGKNVDKYASTFKSITDSGHALGNHTYDHLNGWKSNDRQYLENISKAKSIIDSDLFRPPYGRITRFQLSQLSGEAFKLKTVMWSVLSGDFDNMLSPDECYLNVSRNSGAGSIIVFHDSEKAYNKLKTVLPKVLEHFSSKGYTFELLRGTLVE